MPRSRWCMAVLPTMAATVISLGTMPASPAIFSVSAVSASRTQRRSSSPFPSIAAWIREMTSAPYWLWGLRQLASPSSAPVSPLRRQAAVWWCPHRWRERIYPYRQGRGASFPGRRSESALARFGHNIQFGSVPLAFGRRGPLGHPEGSTGISRRHPARRRARRGFRPARI